MEPQDRKRREVEEAVRHEAAVAAREARRQAVEKKRLEQEKYIMELAKSLQEQEREKAAKVSTQFFDFFSRACSLSFFFKYFYRLPLGMNTPIDQFAPVVVACLLLDVFQYQ
jgi:hypothetical protein